jgi:hypothetical protein
MTEKKVRGPRRSDRPGPGGVEDLKEKRDAFLHTFFKRGAELTDEVVDENRRLRAQIERLEEDNAALRKQVASDRAMRDLLRKIDELEREKSRLLSTVTEQEEVTGRIVNRFAEIESELESFANLYVASFQLHQSLRLRTVVRHIRELLVQLVGARSLAVYFVDEEGRRLAPIASEGVDVETLPTLALGDGAAGESTEPLEPLDPVSAVIERAFLTGVAHVAEGDVASRPVACLPMKVEDRTVGAIVVYDLLAQKPALVTVDRELFKLLGAHAGATIFAAYLYTSGDTRLPAPESLRALLS